MARRLSLKLAIVRGMPPGHPGDMVVSLELIRPCVAQSGCRAASSRTVKPEGRQEPERPNMPSVKVGIASRGEVASSPPECSAASAAGGLQRRLLGAVGRC